MSAALVIRNREGDEVRISLHPVSLGLVAVEVAEDWLRERCRRRGHAPEHDGSDHCRRCGASLPDAGSSGCRAWLPTTYRSFTRADERTSHE